MLLPINDPNQTHNEQYVPYYQKIYTVLYILMCRKVGDLVKKQNLINISIGSVIVVAIGIVLMSGQEQQAFTYGTKSTGLHVVNGINVQGANGGNAAGANGGNANGFNSSNGAGANGGNANGADGVHLNLNGTNNTSIQVQPSKMLPS
jgi:hypothetical protein